MSDSSMLRRVTVVGPRLARGGDFLWKAAIDVVYAGKGNAPTSLAAGTVRSVVDKTFGIRTLLVQDEVHDLKVYPGSPLSSRTVAFRAPALLAVLVQGNDGSLPRVWIYPRTGRSAYNLQPDSLAATVHSLLTTPGGPWPDQTRASEDEPAITLPELRLAEGAIPGVLEAFEDLADPLRLVKAGANGLTVLGSLAATPFEAGKRSLSVLLTPQGIEFDAAPPRILTQLTGLGIDVRLRYRLSTETAAATEGGAVGALGYCLELIGGAAKDLNAVHTALAAIFARRLGCPVRMDYPTATGPPPLRWTLAVNPHTQQLTIDESRMRLAGDQVRVRLFTETPGGAGDPLVAEIAPQSVGIAVEGPATTPSLRVTLDTGAAGAEASDPALDASLRADALFDWSPGELGVRGRLLRPGMPGNPPLPDVAVSADFAALGAALGVAYAAAGVLPPGRTWAPFAFAPVERGWLQLPLPDRPDRRSASSALQGSPPSALGRDVVEGGAAARPWVLTAGDNDDFTRRRVEVDGALQAQLDLTWPLDDRAGAPKVAMRFLQAWGRLRGHLFVATTSPSPVEILPNLAAGPVATRDVVLAFGLGSATQTSARVSWLTSGAVQLDLQPYDDAFAWLTHKTLPLIAAAPMTRTVASGEPSLSRGLVPHRLAKGTGPRLTLRPGSLRPELTLGTPLPWTDGWPWPDLNYVGLASEEPASVVLVMPSLPDARFAWEGFKSVEADDLRVSLCFDLPLLSEFFAGIRTPKAVATAPTPYPKNALGPPTALEPDRLAAAWTEVAEGLSLARTQGAIYVPWSGQASAPVTVTGLVEPYVWKTTFQFDPVHDGLPLGSYKLAGRKVFGTVALAGDPDLKFVADRADGELRETNGLEDYAVKGLAASLRMTGAVAFDNRGLGVEERPHPQQEILVREASFDKGAGSPGTALPPPAAFRYASAIEPIPVTLGSTVAWFWFRDLHLGGDGVFHMGHSQLESAAGPSSSAFDREHLPYNMHEWRFYQATDAIGAEPLAGIDLGPFRFRPLRLVSTTCGPGTDAGLLIGAAEIAGVVELNPRFRLAAASAEPEYESGNLVLLSLVRDGAGLRLDAARRVQVVVDAGSAGGLALGPSGAPLTFNRREAVIAPAGVGKQFASLELTLPDVGSVGADGALCFKDVALRTRLFGAEMRLDKGAFAAAHSGIVCTFDPPDGTMAAVRTGRVTVEVDTDRFLVTLVDLAVRLERPIAADRPALTIFTLLSAKAMTWLGAQLPAPQPVEGAPAQVSVDHERGVIVTAFPQGLALVGEPVRGLSVVGARATGHVALSLVSKEGANWPQAEIGAGILDISAAGEGRGVSLRQQLRIDEDGWVGGDLEVDLPPIVRTSRIKWPIKAFTPPGAADPAPTGKAVALEIGQAGDPLVHHVNVELEGHLLPHHLLVSEGSVVRLAQPWRIHARAEHSIDDLTWTSLEAVSLIDHIGLVAEATVDATSGSSAPAKPEYDFAPHYVGLGYRGSPIAPFMANPGVARRALAAAGIPDLFLAGLIKAAPAAPSPAPALLMVGGAAHLVQIGVDSETRTIGVALTLPWLVAWSDTSAASTPLASALDELRQAPAAERAFRVSDIDLAAGRPFPLGYATSGQLALSADAAEIEASLGSALAEPGAAVAGSSVAWPAEQAFVEPVAPGGLAAKEMPFFLRSLLALRWVLDALTTPESRSAFQSCVRVLVPSGPDAGPGVPRRQKSVTLAIQRRSLPTPPVARARLFVLERTKARSYPVPQDLDLAVVSDAAVRRRLLGVALSIAKAPLAIFAVAEAGAVIDRTGVDPPESADLPRSSQSLRPRDQTLFASAARGWASRPAMPGLPGATAPILAALHEAPIHAPTLALSGRTGSFATPAYMRAAESPTSAAKTATYVVTGRRAVLLRAALSGGGVAPPAGHLTPAATRLRAPTAAALSEALDRIATPGSEVRGMLPGQLERTTFGGRVGTLFVETLGLLTATSDAGPDLDPGKAQFGVRADMSALHAWQLRAPRAGRLPETEDLTRRRRTFVSESDRRPPPQTIDGDPAKLGMLAHCRLTLGPATLMRLDDAATSLELIVLQPGSEGAEPHTPLWGLSRFFAGELSLLARGPQPRGPATSKDVLGLLSKVGLHNPTTRIELRVGDGRAPFQAASVEVHAGTDQVIVRLSMKGLATPPADQNAAALALLATATPDTPPILWLMLAPPEPGGVAADPAAGGFALATKPQVLPLPPGPPRTLTIPLPMASGDAPALPLQPLLTAFGDPAYDRALSTRTQSDRTPDGNWLLAVDRSEYDLGVDVNLAFGKVDQKSNTFLKVGTGGNIGSATLTLLVRRAQGAGPKLPLQLVTFDGESALTVTAGNAHSLPIGALLATSGEGKGLTGLQPGDELIVSVGPPDAGVPDLSVRVRIVAEPTTPAPDAVYGLIIRDGARASVPLYASAPMPQCLEFTDLLNDLAAGYVRRRGLFLWRFPAEGQAIGPSIGALVKVDRGGGGQLPDSLQDFAELG